MPCAPLEIDPLAHTPPFDWGALFGNAQPVELEIGCGKGMFLRQIASANPEVNFLGIEKAGKFYRKGVVRLTRTGLPNIRLMRADGLDVLTRWIAPGSLRALHILFPDPWPKKRHHKRRIFRPETLELAYRALVPGGEFRVATDHEEYGCAIRELFAAHAARFEPVEWPPDAPNRHTTNYEQKWIRHGRNLWWARYRRRGAPLDPLPPTA